MVGDRLDFFRTLGGHFSQEGFEGFLHEEVFKGGLVFAGPVRNLRSLGCRYQIQ